MCFLCVSGDISSEHRIIGWSRRPLGAVSPWVLCTAATFWWLYEDVDDPATQILCLNQALIELSWISRKFYPSSTLCWVTCRVIKTASVGILFFLIDLMAFGPQWWTGVPSRVYSLLTPSVPEIHSRATRIKGSVNSFQSILLGKACCVYDYKSLFSIGLRFLHNGIWSLPGGILHEDGTQTNWMQG